MCKCTSAEINFTGKGSWTVQREACITSDQEQLAICNQMLWTEDTHGDLHVSRKPNVTKACSADCRQCGIELPLTWATQSKCSRQRQQGFSYLTVENKLPVPLQGGYTDHSINIPFLMGKEWRWKEQREVREHWGKKRRGEMDCSVCPHETTRLLMTWTVSVLFLADWHNVLPVIDTWKRFVLGNEYSGLVIQILYKRNPENMTFSFGSSSVQRFLPESDFEFLSWNQQEAKRHWMKRAFKEVWRGASFF